MLQVLIDPILPVFALAAIGFAMGRTGRVSRRDAETLNRFAMTVFFPVFVFELIATAPGDAFSVLPLLIYVAAEAAVFFAAYLLARRGFGLAATESLLLGFAGIFANNAIYTLPITVLLHGAERAVPITGIVILDAVVALGGAMIALEIATGGKARFGTVLWRIARLPMLQGMAAGLAVAALGLALPAPVLTFTGFAGTAAAPLALFALGVVLGETRFTRSPVVLSFTAIKVAVFPLAVWFGLSLFAGGDPSRDMVLLASAGPSGAMAFSLAMLYGVRTENIMQIIVWTCVLTLFSLAALA